MLGVHHDQPVRLGHLRCDFRQMLGARYAYRDRKPQLGPHTAANRFGNLRRWPKETLRASHVGEGLVDGEPFHERREISEYLDGGIAEPLIFIEVAGHEAQLRAEFARPSCRHTTPDSEGLCLV